MRRVFRTLLDSFSPLLIRNLRVYLSGQVVSLLGSWMQVTAQSWVVWQLTHSSAALGLVAMLGSLGFLVLGPWAGVWADRLDRRRILVATQIVAMLLAFTLAFLVQSGQVQLWHVYVLATLLGCVNALDLPSQQAFIGDMSGLDQVRKAVVVNAMVNQVSRMLGPALAGWVIGALGVAPAFWLNGMSFLAVIGTLLAVDARQVRKSTHGNPFTEFKEGMQFIRREPRVQDLMLFTAFATLFGIANMQIMPVFATDVLHRGPEVLGLLMGSSGAGSLTSALLLVPLVQRLRRTGLMLTGALTWSGLSFIGFTFSTWVPLSMAFMFGTALGIPMVMTTANGLLQTLAPPNMRARLLSAWILIGFGLQPLAALLIGTGAHLFGAPTAVRTNGLLMIASAAALLLLRSDLRHWEAHIHGNQPGRGSSKGTADQHGDLSDHVPVPGPVIPEK